jgi:hypothetical protein
LLKEVGFLKVPKKIVRKVVYLTSSGLSPKNEKVIHEHETVLFTNGEK